MSRHSNFGNLGRLLKESVSEYGTPFDQRSPVNIFYHSVAIESITSGLIRFRAPTSTSTSKVVLYNYSSVTGTIIEINSGFLDLKDRHKPRYFDCSWLSDFGIEDEKLFVGQENLLEITNIMNTINYEDYQLFAMSLHIITILFGEVIDSWDKDKKNPFAAISKPERLKKFVKKVLG